MTSMAAIVRTHVSAFGNKKAAFGRIEPTTMRRTVKGKAISGPNFKLEQPEKLWEIGSSSCMPWPSQIEVFVVFLCTSAVDHSEVRFACAGWPFNNYEGPEYLDGTLREDSPRSLIHCSSLQHSRALHVFRATVVRIAERDYLLPQPVTVALILSLWVRRGDRLLVRVCLQRSC